MSSGDPCYAALDDILSLAGHAPTPRDRVRISGADPVLPTNFLIGTAGAAVVSAAGLAAANLWELRTGQRQTVSSEVRRAAMAMRSERFVHRDGKKLNAWDPVSGFYQAGDERWVQLHCNFPHHRARTLEVLGASADKKAVAAEVARWNGLELEEAVTEAGSVDRSWGTTVHRTWLTVGGDTGVFPGFLARMKFCDRSTPTFCWYRTAEAENDGD